MYHVLPLPPRLVVDGLAGGEIVLRELSTAEYFDLDAPDRLLASLESIRGREFALGAAREEWVRSLPAALGRLLSGAVARINSPTDAQAASFKKSRTALDDGRHRFTYPSKEIVEVTGTESLHLSELTFGAVEDALTAARAAKRGKTAAIDLAAKAMGRSVSELRDLPAKIGALVLMAYQEIHNASEEEEAGFFAGAVSSATPPKAI